MKQKEVVGLVLAADAVIWQARALQKPRRDLQEIREQTAYLAGQVDSLLVLYDRSSDDSEDLRKQRRAFIVQARDAFWGGSNLSWGIDRLEAFLRTFRQ